MLISFRRIFFLILTLVLGRSLAALPPDSVLTFTEVKARLMRANLALLAAHYDVQMSRAAVVQARLWNNPYFVFNGDLYSIEANEYFHFRNQHLLQVEQTFSIAGKHTHTVKLAKLGSAMAEKQLEDVMRSLLYEAGNLYGELSALQSKSELFNQVSASYDKLMEAVKKQLEIGAISVTEAIRIESEFLAVRTEALTNRNQIAKTMADLRIILRMPEDTVFRVEQRLPDTVPQLDVRQLMDQAQEGRPDLQLRKVDVEYQERNLRLQQSTGVPDLKLAYQPRDRGSNYVRPYQGFNVEFSIPLFNRNQGEILSARYAMARSGAQLDQASLQVRNEVSAAFSRYRNAYEGLGQYSPVLLQRLGQLNESSADNFRKRNISLLQFIDQQRIYIQTNIQLIELRQQFLQHVNELNFTVGTTVIDY